MSERVCGNCNKWMRKDACPKEVGVMTGGPTSGTIACNEFEPTPADGTVDSFNQAAAEAAADALINPLMNPGPGRGFAFWTFVKGAKWAWQKRGEKDAATIDALKAKVEELSKKLERARVHLRNARSCMDSHWIAIKEGSYDVSGLLCGAQNISEALKEIE